MSRRSYSSHTRGTSTPSRFSNLRLTETRYSIPKPQTVYKAQVFNAKALYIRDLLTRSETKYLPSGKSPRMVKDVYKGYVCASRSVRREIIFASRKHGQGGQKRPKNNLDRYVRC